MAKRPPIQEVHTFVRSVFPHTPQPHNFGGYGTRKELGQELAYRKKYPVNKRIPYPPGGGTPSQRASIDKKRGSDFSTGLKLQKMITAAYTTKRRKR